MSNLYVSVVVLAAYIAACVAIHLRMSYLERRRTHKRRIRQIEAYTMRRPDSRHSNVVSLDTYSRKVDAA